MSTVPPVSTPPPSPTRSRPCIAQKDFTVSPSTRLQTEAYHMESKHMIKVKLWVKQQTDSMIDAVKTKSIVKQFRRGILMIAGSNIAERKPREQDKCSGYCKLEEAHYLSEVKCFEQRGMCRHASIDIREEHRHCKMCGLRKKAVNYIMRNFGIMGIPITAVLSAVLSRISMANIWIPFGAGSDEDKRKSLDPLPPPSRKSKFAVGTPSYPTS
ncbi:hypothetical protein C8F04DRAFT_1184715 [Mycena alexandri]|uniref:Uncharacterized protein n=1 Tax=Mycena alexandri TaxID=1745969 RepID=A0AAD6SRK1_9AGAR|nr:hypothetical protein C8F04DRAFT_1184715 [Mycena alexandri]